MEEHHDLSVHIKKNNYVTLLVLVMVFAGLFVLGLFIGAFIIANNSTKIDSPPQIV